MQEDETGQILEGIAHHQAAHGRQRGGGRRARRGKRKDRPASYEVKAGDVIEIRFGEKLNRYEVLSVQDNVGKAGAADLYRPLP